MPAMKPLAKKLCMFINEFNQVFVHFNIKKQRCTLRKKRTYSEFFWSVFRRIWTEYLDLLKSPYSVRMRENTDQKNSEFGHL